MFNEQTLSSLIPVLPAIGLILAGCAVLVCGLFQSETPVAEVAARSNGWAWASLMAMLVIWGSWALSGSTASDQVGQLFRCDMLGRSGIHMALLAGVLITAITVNKTPSSHAVEYHSGILFLVAGLIFVSTASDLTTLYLGLELVSIPTILLLAVSRQDDAGSESTLKYFALSAFSSAIFLMGCSYLFGLAGSTSIESIVAKVGGNITPLGYVAFGLVIAGLAFRVTAVPFHFYASDIFVGSALPVAALMSTLPKLAGFLAMLRLLGGIQLSAGLVPVALTTLVLVGLLTMTVGNCAALVQTNCRRMLAYSSVAQSGYLLLGVAGILVQGELVRSVLVYLSAYVVMTLGFFAGLCSTAGSPNQKLDLEELDGLSGKNVLVGGAMTVCLLSLIGIPVTAGFWGKFFILRDLLAPSTSLLIIGAIVMVANSAIAAVYYLGLLMRVNTNQVSSGGAASLSNAHDCASTDLPATIACVACAALTLIWFVFPKWM